MPPGIEFACPHCLRVTKVPANLAGKQGRCAGCKKVIEVPSTGPATGGRTPDPDEGLLEVLEARRKSERAQRAAERRPSDRGQVDDDDGPAPRASGRRPSDRGAISGRRPSDRGPAPPPITGVPDDVPEPSEEESTARIPPPSPSAAPGDRRKAYVLWASQVPPMVWVGFALAFPFPALGIGLSVLGLRRAKAAGVGLRLAWAGIIVGSVIMALNLGVLAWKVTHRRPREGSRAPEAPSSDPGPGEER